MPKVIKPEDNIKRDEILEKILEILGKKDGQNEVTFFLSKMDIDEESQKRIYELEQNIKKYYVCGTWTCFAKDENVVKRKWLSMVKYICKEHKKTLKSTGLKIDDDKCDTLYKIK